MAARSVDEHIASAPAQAQSLLKEMHLVIRQAAPGATESISYGIPTYDLAGEHVVHFAGYAGHVSLYPGAGGIQAFKEELGSRATGKGTAQFPLDQPLPADLIRRIVEFRVSEVLARH